MDRSATRCRYLYKRTQQVVWSKICKDELSTPKFGKKFMTPIETDMEN